MNKSTQLVLPSASATPVSLELDANISKEQYFEVGKKLALIESANQWWIGDWLNGADPAYGEHEKVCKVVGLNYNTAKVYAYTCKQIGMRIPDLTFYHHQIVAALSTAEQDEWLANADDNDWTTGKLRAEFRLANPPEIPDLPDDKYNLVYCDPPWRYEFAESPTRTIENQYPTLALDEICGLEDGQGRKVTDIFVDDCLIFLWATSPKLSEAFGVLDAWGFEYRTCMVWVKDKIGMGYYARQKHELLLIATKGQPGTPAEAERPASVIEAPRTLHSRKPEVVYEIIEGMFPRHKRVELFQRQPRAGWTGWGNEVQG